MRDSVLVDESLQLSIDSVQLYKYLTNKKEYILSNQFLRSATSIGANIREAKYSESRKDFIHKFKIALKECNETLYWIELIKCSEGEEIRELEKINKRCVLILRLLIASIKTCEYRINEKHSTS